jgi:hypothetical protein
VAAKNITLQSLADLISQGQGNAKERLDDLKADLNAKHKENVDRRHELVERYGILEARVTVLERDMRTVVGDNTGGSGLLHNIDKKVDELQAEVAGMKRVYLFLGFLIPIIVTIILALIFKH